MHRLIDIVDRATRALEEKELSEFSIVFVFTKREDIERMIHMLDKHRIPNHDPRINIILGRGELTESSGKICGFEPYEKINTAYLS